MRNAIQGGKLFCCSQCGMIFTQFRHLTDHEVTHTGKMPYHCSQCGKAYFTSHALSLHERTHTVLPPLSHIFDWKCVFVCATLNQIVESILNNNKNVTLCFFLKNMLKQLFNLKFLLLPSQIRTPNNIFPIKLQSSTRRLRSQEAHTYNVTFRMTFCIVFLLI